MLGWRAIEPSSPAPTNEMNRELKIHRFVRPNLKEVSADEFCIERMLMLCSDLE
ncbi:hypothetical protein GCM10007895_14530 [Paraferrimonas sedimenticola]|uniref:Uncharacterized protein n=1 Tax=Paraferrimonas sedimenticola TaxID=375674 RepID=A0AA37W1E4_9GAMM|nr:hypothetical protein GCM10007895_14530 [Paraferrimonas sedimenticola]